VTKGKREVIVLFNDVASFSDNPVGRGGMKCDTVMDTVGNTEGKPVPLPLDRPQIPHVIVVCAREVGG